MVSAGLAFLAFRRRSKPLGFAAGLIGSVALSAVLLVGFVVFPILFWVWRRNPGQGFGRLFLASLVLSTLALAWRLPWPSPAPVGSVHEATALVRQVKEVHDLWSDWRSAGQGLPQPFQMVDLEFTPAGATTPVRILDRVDLNGIAGLAAGGTVPVTYSALDPRDGHISHAPRTYASKALFYILALTWAIALALGLVLFPLVEFAARRLRTSPLVSTLLDAGAPPERLHSLPADDPRRKALEGFFRRPRSPGD